MAWMALVSKHPMTAEDLSRHPDRDRYELVAGTLRGSEPPGGVHGQVAMSLGYRLHGFVVGTRLGVVLVESGFVLRRGPDTVRGSDLSFVTAERLGPGVVPAGFLPVAPDLAVETRSPDDRPAEVAEKVANYLDAGTRLVWVVDPANRDVVVYRADGSVTRLGAMDWLDGEAVLAGFRCLVGEVLPS
jgi:Uma2 family endonuclease